jgi:hypothetical protein
MIREGFSIIRGIDDRYDGRRHNPWNEVECGDHYARAMSSWGCLIALSGLIYDGPAGRLGFAPRWQADDFRAFFTAAEGWGTLRQTRKHESQTNAIDLKYGSVRLRELVFELPKGAKHTTAHLEIKGHAAPHRSTQTGQRVEIILDEPLIVKAGETLSATITWKKRQRDDGG